ncbi:MAG: pyrroline-5-carboxylate reductase [Deltaproteobacteria bacterium]|nr:pyrroline-5-carboxylate reductase [Deltaproteobacteria bacterium]
MEKPLGIIGGGNMGEALIAGLIHSGLLSPAEILFSEPRPERRAYLQEKFRVSFAETNRDLVTRAPTLILAVKPQSVPEVLAEIAQSLKPHHLIISICAGVPLDYIQSFIPRPIRMVRAMPNTPALIQKGATALAPSPAAQAKDLSTAEAIFQAVGITAIVKESQMDAVTGLSGSGPAYVFAVIEALAAGGVKEGLSQDVALNLTTQTVLGAAHLIQATAKHPATLRDQVCTPGGTTMAGLYAMEEGGFRLALMNAVIAATQRSKELGEALQKLPSSSPPGRTKKIVDRLHKSARGGLKVTRKLH